MFDTPLTVVGRIITNPTKRQVGNQDVVKFRLASSTRRRTADGHWEYGNSLYLTVNCWAKLATGVISSVTKGSMVIVVGSVYTSEYEDREGNRRSSLEMRANAVGPDLSRYVANLATLQEVSVASEEVPADAVGDGVPVEEPPDAEPAGEESSAPGAFSLSG